MSHSQALMGGEKEPRNEADVCLIPRLSWRRDKNEACPDFASVYNTYRRSYTCVVRPNPSTRLLTPICREKTVSSR